MNEKLDAITKCIQGDMSIEYMAKLQDIDGESLDQGIRNYEAIGIDGLITTSQNTRYTSEFKKKAVIGYLSGNASQAGICKKDGIHLNKKTFAGMNNQV